MADEEGTVIVVVVESEREKKEARVWVLGMTREKIWVAIVANGVSSGNDIGNEIGFRVFGFLITMLQCKISTNISPFSFNFFLIIIT